MRIGRALAFATVAWVATACTTGQYFPATTEIGFPPTTSAAPIPAVVTSATPSGWVPVAYGNIQVSVPTSFSVLYPGWNACGTASFPGVLELGLPVMTKVGCGAAPQPSVTVVEIAPYRPTWGLDAGPPTVLNGLNVHPLVVHITGKVVGYYAPALGMEVIGNGPLAQRIFRSLTRSPRAVVLAPGSAPSVPSGWPTVMFQGLAFNALASWPVTRTPMAGAAFAQTCGVFGMTLGTVEVALSTGLQPPLVVHCPSRVGQSRPQRPRDGVEVDGSPVWFPIALSFSEQCLHLHGLTACPATTPDYSILVLKVTVPGRSTAVIVSIGLAGSGMVARTILYSLRAA